MRLVVNGKPASYEGVGTVSELLLRLGIAPEGVAVAINAEVVPRAEHARRPLREQDRVEIVRAVGGG